MTTITRVFIFLGVLLAVGGGAEYVRRHQPPSGTVLISGGMPTPLYTSTGVVTGSTVVTMPSSLEDVHIPTTAEQRGASGATGEPGFSSERGFPSTTPVFRAGTLDDEHAERIVDVQRLDVHLNDLMGDMVLVTKQLQLLNGRVLKLERQLQKEPTQ